MRLALLACCVVFAVAGCGGAEDEASAPAGDPDQPVSSPADPAPPAAGTPTSTKACRRLGRRIVRDPVEHATERAERRGCVLRVAVLDGEAQILTEDFQPARINVRVRDGVVTGVEFMG
jgi:hypothetical protein